MGKSEQKSLESGMIDATSIESIPEDYPYNKWHMKPIMVRELVNNITGTRYRFNYFMDPDRRIWYETEVLGTGGWRSQEEYIFGHKIQKKSR